MHRGHEHPMYTGLWPQPFAAPMPYPFPHPATYQHHGEGHGFCHACCHPVTACCCGCRECRKEAKELLVTPTIKEAAKNDRFTETFNAARTFVNLSSLHAAATAAGEARAQTIAEAVVVQPAAVGGLGAAFIGGGCCVHLSVEYAPSSPTAVFAVLLLVTDSEGTALGWFKLEKAGAGYQVRENIITTKPGAHLAVAVLNATARVRWCEIFSC